MESANDDSSQHPDQSEQRQEPQPQPPRQETGLESRPMSTVGLAALRRAGIEPSTPPGSDAPPGAADAGSPETTMEHQDPVVSDLSCAFCGSKFASNKALKFHEKNTKKCLKKRTRTPQELEDERKAAVRAKHAKYNAKRARNRASIRAARLEPVGQSTPTLSMESASVPSSPTEPRILGSCAICVVDMEEGETGIVRLVCGHYVHESCRDRLFAHLLMDRVVQLKFFIESERDKYRQLMSQEIPRRSADREHLLQRYQARDMPPAPSCPIDLSLTQVVERDEEGSLYVRAAPNNMRWVVKCPLCQRWSDEIPLVD